jgi:acetyl-CoA C-acetyltransferase
MTFGGGPLNNYTLQALVKMVDIARADPSAQAMVTNVSGMLTKFGLSVWSCRPPARPFAAVDVTAEATASTATVALDPSFTGAADVVTYTVAFDRGGPTTGIVLCDTTAGDRALATTTDPGVITDMLEHDWCGRSVDLAGAALA